MSFIAELIGEDPKFLQAPRAEQAEKLQEKAKAIAAEIKADKQSDLLAQVNGSGEGVAA